MLQYQGLVQQAQSANFSPISFFPAAQSLAQSAYQGVQQNCSGGATQTNQTCTNSINFFQKAASLPSVAIQDQTQQQSVIGRTGHDAERTHDGCRRLCLLSRWSSHGND
jgi:hypothetical protein